MGQYQKRCCKINKKFYSGTLVPDRQDGMIYLRTIKI